MYFFWWIVNCMRSWLSRFVIFQNPQDKREIFCDVALKRVMGGEDKVTMFSMNKYMWVNWSDEGCYCLWTLPISHGLNYLFDVQPLSLDLLICWKSWTGLLTCMKKQIQVPKKQCRMKMKNKQQKIYVACCMLHVVEGMNWNSLGYRLHVLY